MNFLDIALLACALAAAGVAIWALRRHAGGGTLSISFKTLADVAPAGIWRTTADGHCIYVNQALQEQTGRPEEECIGNGWADAIHPEDKERVFAKWYATVARRERYRDEWRWLRPDGSTLWVTTLGAPEFNERGDLVGYVGINIDIQRSKELEADLKRARERAEETTAAKTNFLANMSHEIRTPMNGVIGFTDMLLQSDLTEEQQRHVQLIADSGRAMMNLLNDILDLSKIEVGQLELHPEPTDVRQKIRHCARLLEPQARAKGVSLEQDVAEDFPQLVEADRLRLRQVLMNLIGNAVKFTERGTVCVHASVEDNGVQRCALIEVRDTGIGIAPDKLGRIFEPFTQEDGSITRRYGGTGLGLSITSQLVDMMGGKISVESEVGQGTSFAVRFPLKAIDGQESEQPEKLDHGNYAFLKGKRVLIAEDHQINQQLIMAMAEALGLDASLVEDGSEAVAAVVQAERDGAAYDAVLMDVQMPHMDGLEAAAALRRRGFGQDMLPIIALTANCYPDDIAACRQAGMQAHVGKPVNYSALARELLAVLTGPPMDIDPRSMMAHSSPSLRAKYVDRKDTLAALVDAALDEGTDASAIDWKTLRTEMHNLAGVAGNFGDAELGEACSRLEKRLRDLDGDDAARLRALREDWTGNGQARAA